MGHPELLTWPEDAATALRGGRAMLTLGLTRLGKFDQAVIDEFYPVLLQAYGASIDRFTTFYPGALQAVQDLKSAGCKVGICTNKPFDLAEDLMIRMGQRALFDSLIGADSLPVRKPDPAPFFEAVRQAGGRPEKAFMIGDTAHRPFYRKGCKCTQHFG
jgi:phosphoglycolate phosphatase